MALVRVEDTAEAEVVAMALVRVLEGVVTALVATVQEGAAAMALVRVVGTAQVGALP